jgi:hypothetical protein
MMNRRRLFHMTSLSVAAIAVLGSPGCGSGPPKPADPAAARAALERALTAWSEGKSVESLKDDDPPIVVSDHAWLNGARLVKYQIEPGDRRAGADQNFQVVLWLEDDKARAKSKGKGGERREKTEYNVGTNPILTVIRPF